MASTVIVQPVFVVPAAITEYHPFTGVKNGIYRGSDMECRFIINCLREHFGDELAFDDLPDGRFAVHDLTPAQQVQFKAIYQDSHEFPLIYGRCFLTFVGV